MLGIRGFPDVQGGVESHAQNLSINLVELGCEVEVIVRSPYVPRLQGSRTWKGIKLTRLWAARIPGLEAFLHSLLGVLRSAWNRPDVLHIHSIGPALFTPLARALGLRVVVTHHVLNYENDKWGPFARAVLRMGERAGMRCANARIAVSEPLASRMEAAYAIPVTVIPNGICPPEKVRSSTTLKRFGLKPNRYVLSVARIDVQKRQLDLIDAFSRTKHDGWKLALVGAADYGGKYARQVCAAAQSRDDVIMLGQQPRGALAELYLNAGVFVLPSSHEGQPIAVLEAISYGCPLILSDIAAHREIAVSIAQFVSVGETAALATCLDEVFRGGNKRLDVSECDRIMKMHAWRGIAERTLDVYLSTISDTDRVADGDLLPV
jgi:glycosyltransferase involved in cell wall biosynthesis